MDTTTQTLAGPVSPVGGTGEGVSAPAKPLGHRSYGSIPHLPGSKRGPADKGLTEHQAAILTTTPRRGDAVYVFEKIDGSNVGIAKIGGQIVPLTRAGYRAETSPYRQHHLFASWVLSQWGRWDALLEEGERLCGEWLAQAHGIRYDLRGREPFWAFDLMRGDTRALYRDFSGRLEGHVQYVPCLIQSERGVPVAEALKALGRWGSTGMIPDAMPEGAVYRVEREGRVDFLGKYVRPDFDPGRHLPERHSDAGAVWNWLPPA